VKSKRNRDQEEENDSEDAAAGPSTSSGRTGKKEVRKKARPDSDESDDEALTKVGFFSLI
jgi:hypothetical protein